MSRQRKGFPWALAGAVVALGVVANVLIVATLNKAQTVRESREAKTRRVVAPPETSGQPQPISSKPAHRISSAEELRARADGELVAVSGRMGGASGGINDWLTAPGEAPTTDASPLFTVTLADGSRVLCHFGAIPRSEFDRWQRNNPPGTEVSVKGTYQGRKDGAYLLTFCEIPGGFR